MIGLWVAAALAFEPGEEDRAWGPDTGGSECPSVQVTSSVPAAGAVDVPVDVHPSLIFDGQCGGPAYNLTVTDPATGSVLASLAWTLPATVPAVATLVPPAPLPPDTDLVLAATDVNAGYDLASIPFRTGAAEVVPLQGTLIVEVLWATVTRQEVSDLLTASVRVTPIDDPSGLSLVSLSGLHGSSWYEPVALSEPVTITWSAAEAPAEVCFDAVQVDGAGNEIGPARDCAQLDPMHDISGCGCDGSRAPVGLGAVGLLLLTRRLRSRR